jgi:hypothetical protein
MHTSPLITIFTRTPNIMHVSMYVCVDSYFKGSKRHGTGQFRFNNGDIYDGQWVDDEIMVS